MREYSACIFDMDGTVLDTLSTIAHYGNKALRAFGFAERSVEEYKYFAGCGAKTLVHCMLDALGRDTEENFKAVYPYYIKAYEEDTSYLTAPYPGIEEMLRALKGKGIKTAVLTNKPDAAAQSVRSEMFSPDAFSVCLGQTEQVPIKPAPDGALLIAKKLGVSPSECLYIGDTWVDMETGRAAGMDTVGVLWGFRERAELEQHGAKYIIERPEQLLQIIQK